MKGKGIVINLFGPDGAGKTTLAILIVYYFTKYMHKRTVYVKFGTFTLPARIIEQLLIVLTNRYVIRQSPGRTIKRLQRTIVAENFPIQLLWSFTNFIGSLLYSLLTVFIPKKFGYIVIVEDFIPRIVADYYYALGSFSNNPIIRLLIAAFLSMYGGANASTVRIFVDASFKTIRRRRRVYMEPHEYLLIVKAVSRTLVRIFPNSLIIVTDSRSVSRTFHELLKYILTSSKLMVDKGH